MKRILVTLIVFASLIALLFGAIKKIRIQADNIERLKSNVTAMADNLDYYRTVDSVWAAKSSRLTQTVDELKATNGNLVAELNKMNIKLKHLQSVDAIQQQGNYNFTADTIFVYDTILKKEVPALEYHDEWIDFKMIAQTVDIQTRDSIIVARTQRTRKFLFWTWRKYTGQVTVINKNPYAQITGVREIDISN